MELIISLEITQYDSSSVLPEFLKLAEKPENSYMYYKTVRNSSTDNKLLAMQNYIWLILRQIIIDKIYSLQYFSTLIDLCKLGSKQNTNIDVFRGFVLSSHSSFIYKNLLKNIFNKNYIIFIQLQFTLNKMLKRILEN